MLNVRELKVGDKLECIDAVDGDEYLNLGEVYTFVGLTASGESINVRNDDGERLTFYASHFRKVGDKVKLPVDKIKRIEDSYLRFTSLFDKSVGDYIVIKVEPTQALLDMIKKVIVSGEVASNYMSDDVAEVPKRYKVRGWVYYSLGDYRDILFLKDLVDKGFVELKYKDKNRVDRLMSNAMDVTRQFIGLINKFEDLDVTVKFKVRE